MLKQNSVKTINRAIRIFMRKYSPEILTGIGIAGMTAAAVTAVQATPKALKLVKRKEAEIGRKLSKTETIKVAWKCYIPSGATGLLSAACLVGASSKNSKRNAALAAACAISENALSEYSEKVTEAVGEKKEGAIKDAVAKNILDKNPVEKNQIIITEKGNTLCYDVISGRYFKSDIEKLRKTENVLNRLLLDEMTVSLNDLYYEFGLDSTKIGDELGWNIEDGFLEFRFCSQLASDGTPCLVVDYETPPKYGYYDN